MKFCHTFPPNLQFCLHICDILQLWLTPPAFESKVLGAKCHVKLNLAKKLGKSPRPISFVK